MEHKIIKTDNYLLVVSDEEIKVNDWFYLNDAEIVVKYVSVKPPQNAKKIIAHLPPNNSPILEGVDLLPPLEDEIIGKPLDNYIRERHNQDECVGFIDGYNKAREKYKYTEEDMRKAIDMATTSKHDYTLIFFNSEEIIQSLHQYPTEFETVDEYPVITDDDYFLKEEKSISKPKTITTAQGRQWVGKYK